MLLIFLLSLIARLKSQTGVTNLLMRGISFDYLPSVGVQSIMAEWPSVRVGDMCCNPFHVPSLKQQSHHTHLSCILEKVKH